MELRGAITHVIVYCGPSFASYGASLFSEVNYPCSAFLFFFFLSSPMIQITVEFRKLFFTTTTANKIK